MRACEKKVHNWRDKWKNLKMGEYPLEYIVERADRSGQFKRKADKIISDLRQAFMRDYTIEEACHFAGINNDTYCRWRNESMEFAVLVDDAKEYVVKKSKNIISDALDDKLGKRPLRLDEKIALAQWLLSRRQRSRYAKRMEQTGEDGKPMEVTLTTYKKEDLEKMSEEELQKVGGDQVRREAERRGKK